MILLKNADLEVALGAIRQCTKEEYEARLDGVLDNYNRVQEYVNMQDYLYEHFLQ